MPRWLQGSDSLQNGAQALEDFANTLQWAQSQAVEAVAKWQRGDAATAQAKAAHDRVVADAEAKTRENQQKGDPTVVQPPAFADLGEVQRQEAREMLGRARQQLQEAGNVCADTLRVEASLAPAGLAKAIGRQLLRRYLGHDLRCWRRTVEPGFRPWRDGCGDGAQRHASGGDVQEHRRLG
nr:hypothetical protein [Amycolatopsis sulphurea]